MSGSETISFSEGYAKMKHLSEAAMKPRVRQKSFKNEDVDWFGGLLAVETTKGRKGFQTGSLCQERKQQESRKCTKLQTTNYILVEQPNVGLKHRALLFFSCDWQSLLLFC